MRRKRKIRKAVIVFIIIIIFFSVGAFFYMKHKNLNNEQNNTIKEPVNNKQEEPKVEEPTNGETDDNKITTKLKNEEYYIEKNLDRYLSYAEKYPDKSMDEVIRDVNAKIDYDFYTNVSDSKLEDGTLILVNKYNRLSESYVPELVTMEDGYSRAYTKKMNPIAYEHLKEMINIAALDGIILYDVSSYRSYNTQNTLYNNYVSRDGKEAADRYSARPGYSEHQTGLATDLNTASTAAHFENSKEYAWLQKNAYKYGFILRYPQDKEYLTGYKFEPWHYRYVGVDIATYISKHDITYEEYYAYFIDNR